MLLLPLIPASGCRSLHSAHRQVRIIAFGDSTTAGPTDRDYPEILRERLRLPPGAVANEGRSAEATTEGLVRLRSLLVARTYRKARALIYWEGGHDVTAFLRRTDRLLLHDPDAPDYPHREPLDRLLDETETNIAAALRAARKARLKVYVATYYPIRESFFGCDAMPFGLLTAPQAGRANRYVELLNERIRRAAGANKARLVDVAVIGPLLAEDGANYHDCVHLSARGNALVVDRLLESRKVEKSK